MFSKPPNKIPQKQTNQNKHTIHALIKLKDKVTPAF